MKKSIVAARYYGSKDEDLLKRSVAGSIVTGIGVTVVLVLISRIFLYPLLELLGTPPDMGRPKKKKLEEMTELERLRYENERLRAENALLKKVRALVEEREARLREIGRKPSKN